MKRNRSLTITAMLAAASICIFVIEMQLPPLAPIPGIKPGLSNIVVLIALCLLGRRTAFAVLLLRIIICAVLLGQGISIIYSLAGGILALMVMSLMIKALKEYIWVVSVFGAVFHNIGQLCAACVLLNSFAVFGYFPVLMISGIITGIFTGLASQFLLTKSRVWFYGYIGRNRE